LNKLAFIESQKPFVPNRFLSHEHTVRAYRDPTVPTIQYNGLGHVTLYHTYPLWGPHQSSIFKNRRKNKKLGARATTHHWYTTPKHQAPHITATTKHKQLPDVKKLNDPRCVETEPAVSLVITLMGDGSLHNIGVAPDGQAEVLTNVRVTRRSWITLRDRVYTEIYCMRMRLYIKDFQVGVT